jgi:hypothetical protein
MARGRMLDKSISYSKKAALAVKLGMQIKSENSGIPLGEFTRIVYDSLLTHTDDFGRLDGDPFTIQHLCVPTFTHRTSEDIEIALTILDTTGLITWYDSGSGLVIQIVKFDEHQVGLSRRTKSDYPEYKHEFQRLSVKFTEVHALSLNFTEVHASSLKFSEDAVSSSSRTRAEQNRTEEKRTEVNTTAVLTSVQATLPPVPIPDSLSSSNSLPPVDVSNELPETPTAIPAIPAPEPVVQELIPSEPQTELQKFFEILKSCPEYAEIFDESKDTEIFNQIKKSKQDPSSVATQWTLWFDQYPKKSKVKALRRSLLNASEWEKKDKKPAKPENNTETTFDSSKLTPDVKTWNLVLLNLKNEISQSNIEEWIKPSKLFNISNGFIVETPSKYHRDFIIKHFLEEITEALKVACPNHKTTVVVTIKKDSK